MVMRLGGFLIRTFTSSDSHCKVEFQSKLFVGSRFEISWTSTKVSLTRCFAVCYARAESPRETERRFVGEVPYRCALVFRPVVPGGHEGRHHAGQLGLQARHHIPEETTAKIVTSASQLLYRRRCSVGLLP